MANDQVPKSVRSIRTESLNVVLAGKNRILVETAAGQRLTIQGDDQGVVIQDDAGDSIHLQGGGIQIRASATVSLECSVLEISASMITVNAPTTQFSGTVQADTLIANAVVANSYTPGAGNLW